MNKEQSPKYADVTPEMMQKARTTGEFIESHAAAAETSWRRSVRPAKTSGRGNPGWGTPAPPNFRAEAFLAAREAEVDDPEGQISVTDMKRVDEMLEDAHTENDARDIVKNKGRVPEAESGDSSPHQRFAGYSKEIGPGNDVAFGTTKGGKRRSYRLRTDGGAVIKESSEYYGPGRWSQIHEFVGAEGEVASKAIQSIASSRIRRTNQKRRIENIRKAEEVLSGGEDDELAA